MKFIDAVIEKNKLILRLLAIGLLALLVWRLVIDLSDWLSTLANLKRVPYTLIVIAAFESILVLFVLTLLFKPDWLIFLTRLRKKIKYFRWPFILTMILLADWFLLWDRSLAFSYTFTRGTFLLALWLVLAWLASNKKIITWKGAFTALTIFASLTLFAFRIYQTSDYPFSNYWSEGNRIWDYSLFYGSHLYNYPTGEAIYSLTDKGRQMIWGIPFLLSGTTIRIFRIWDVLMFSIPYMLLGWSLFIAEARKNFSTFILLGLASFLFLDQGPIYAPLILAALLVALTKRSPLWLAIPAVILASYFARFSRFTWTFAPGMFAVMWAFIDQDFDVVKGFWQRWGRALILGASALFGGLGIFSIIKLINGSQSNGVRSLTAEGVSSAITQHPLIWSRLFPSPTYPTGILLALVIATAPIIILIVWLIGSKRWRLHFWQKLSLFGFLLVFQGVGIVISAKAGGGSNLHNMDMFLIGVIFTAALAWKNALRDLVLNHTSRPVILNILMILIVLIPAWRAGQALKLEPLPKQSEVQAAMNIIKESVDDARKKGEVLFMDQRQLITFGEVGDIPLIVDYEKKLMMNKAMEEDEQYFNQYYQDLFQKRFSLIVSEPLTIRILKDKEGFGFENDVWVKWVTIPTKCFYETLYRSDEVKVELLVPREEPLKQYETFDCPTVKN